MRKIIGILIILTGIFAIFYIDIYLLITSIIDIAKNFDTMSTSQLTKDILLILFREVIGGVVGFVIIFIGWWIGVFTSKPKKEIKKQKSSFQERLDEMQKRHNF